MYLFTNAGRNLGEFRDMFDLHVAAAQLAERCAWPICKPEEMDGFF